MYGEPPRGRTPPRVGLQLFIAGLSFMLNERDVERKFSRYGRVKVGAASACASARGADEARGMTR